MSYDISGFYKYIDNNKDGIVLKKNAPESAKKAYEEFIKAQKEAEKRNLKI